MRFIKYYNEHTNIKNTKRNKILEGKTDKIKKYIEKISELNIILQKTKQENEKSLFENI